MLLNREEKKKKIIIHIYHMAANAATIFCQLPKPLCLGALRLFGHRAPARGQKNVRIGI
jgi:hypothetical protein